MDKTKTIIFSLCALLIVLAGGFVSGSNDKERDIKECRTCHAPAQQFFRANDTIDTAVCYNCHREDIEFSIPISIKVHIYHDGNATALPLMDFMERHKKDITSDCESCHIFTGGMAQNCRQCHTAGNHISDNKDKECSSCHGQIRDLFRHPSIELVSHDIFGARSCSMCHSQDKLVLQLANGARVPVLKASGLCKQCHSGVYRDWSDKKHHSEAECTACHDPHSPIASK